MGRAETLLILFAFVIVSSFAWSSSPGFTVRTKGDWILHPAKLCKGSAHGVSSLHLAGASLLSSSKGRRAASLPLAEIWMTSTAEEKSEESAAKVREGERILGSRRLAAATKVIKEGAPTSEGHGKLLGSKRLSIASEIIIKTPKDKSRMLGSKRLRTAREILFQGVTVAENNKMFGSKRLAKAKEVLTKGVRESNNEFQMAAQAVREFVSSSPPPEELTEDELAEDAKAETAAVPDTVMVVKEPEGPLQFGGVIATDDQIAQVKKVREQIKKIDASERAKMTDWIDEMLDVDIFRYVNQFKNKAFERIKATAVFRKEENIDDILYTDAAKFESYFEAGKEEIVYLAPDKTGRPILLYRAAEHWPGVQDPKEYTRYILYQTEKTRLRIGLGIDRQSCVLVDRVGSGRKNQDPALLQVLLPTVLSHYPMYIGDVYIAPISTVFYLVWQLIQIILDEATKKRFHLLKDDYTTELQKIVVFDSLPTTLGGGLDVPAFCASVRDLDKAEEQLAQLEEQMDADTGEMGEKEVAFGGKPGTGEEIMQIAELRVNIASLAQEDNQKYGKWLQELENNDLLRFVRVHKTADAAWKALLVTANWRQENGVNTVCNEDLSKTFEEGKQEVFLLPPDKKGRPVIVYRSGIHFPGKVPNKDFARFVLQLVENGRNEYDLGITREVCILVDRVGSGKKNQDIGLLRELLPILQTHYPQTVGAIYIAPINMVLAALLFDEDTKSRIVLVRGDIGPELLKTIPAEVLPKNLGGERLVPEAGVV